MKYPHLAARIFNTPLLIHPAKLDAIIAGLGPRLLGTEALHSPVVVAQAPELFSTRRGARAERGYTVTDGVAVISAMGALVHRSRFEMADSTFLLGYNDLAADIEDAMANPDVHALALVWDSPGGEVAGAFELADRLMALRGKKPMTAVVDNLAASAGYLAASAADQVVITTTGYAGSIGVVMRHVDFSQALHADGIKVTHIFAGAHKVDGNPMEPLPEAVRADWQAEVNGLLDQFVGAVQAQRGLTAAAIRKTQAQVYRGQAAIDVGLADRIGTTDAVITELAALRARSFPVGTSAHATAAKGATMSGTTTGGQQAATPPQTFTQADLDAARAEGVKQGAQAERERGSAILAHDAAKGRTELALQCVATGLTVEQSAAILGAAPAAAAAAGQGSQFAQHMAALGNPKVSGTDAPQEDANPAAIAASWDAAFGTPAGRA